MLYPSIYIYILKPNDKDKSIYFSKTTFVIVVHLMLYRCAIRKDFTKFTFYKDGLTQPFYLDEQKSNIIFFMYNNMIANCHIDSRKLNSYDFGYCFRCIVLQFIL